jgi:hypothetical protein
MKLPKSKQAEARRDRVGKTPFASFCRIPAACIEALADDVYQVNVVMGLLTFRYRKRDSNSGRLFLFKQGDDTSVLAGAWYASVLRPLVIAAIEEKFNVELPHFDAETDDQKACTKWERLHCPELIFEGFPGISSDGAEQQMVVTDEQPRGFVRRWIADNIDRFTPEAA